MALKPGQLKCIQTLDKPIVVAAGAGSGKTFTLTKRIVGALESGYIDDIGQVCAITFTNKAAAELKSRVKSELRACGMVEQALKADDAWISTIHGMCARILRAHAVELDIDPMFKIADASLVRMLQEQSVNEVLALARVQAGNDDAAQGQGLPAALSPKAVAALFDEYPADSQGFGASSVRGMLQALLEAASSHPRGVDAFALPPEPASAASLLQVATDAFGLLVDASTAEKESASLSKWLADAQPALDDARKALDKGAVDGPMEALRLIAGMKVSRNFGSKPFKEFASNCAFTVGSCTMELRLAAAYPHLRTLVALASQVLWRFEAKKRREGVLDNNDLLVLAARAMEEHPGIAAQYADRFRLVMVDEFQDTDQMQVDMIKRIAGADAERLCTVGDAQQSIYRFRGADVSVYRRHLASVRSKDADGIIVLPDNFRSHADILALVDRVFERQDMFGGEFMSLAPGRDEAAVKRPLAPGKPRVQVYQVTKAYRSGIAASQLVQEQARRIAQAFAGLRDAGHTAGEMALLLGRMSNAGVYARALREQGLACVVSGGSVFAGTPEAQMMLELARAAVNPHDTQALWNVLAGPMFRVPDNEMLALTTALDERDGLPRRRKLDAGMRAEARARREREDPEAVPTVEAKLSSPQAECALQVLGNLWRAVGRSQLSRCLMRAVVDSGWASRLESQGPEGLAAAGNVYKAIRLMEDLEKGTAAGPVGMLRAFEEMLELSKEAPGALSTSGGDFVRIMTVHASKGLEFPIVAVAEFPDKGADSSRLLVLPDESGILLSLDLGNSRERLGGLVSGVKPEKDVYPMLLDGLSDEDSLKQAAGEADDALTRRAAMSVHGLMGDTEEAKRLLYVALTRARECLVVALAGTITKDNPNGIPKNCLKALPLALAGQEGFAQGCTEFDFGGSAAAVAVHVELKPDDEPDDQAEAADNAVLGAQPAALFAVPEVQPYPHVLRIPYSNAHEGVFSYSSVSEASHEGDLLERLAQAFAMGCDEAVPDEPWLQPERPDEAGFLYRQRREDRLAAQGEDDDGSWAYLGSDCSDADKATDYGTAFHRLAQHSVDTRVPGMPLQPPSASRVRKMMAACHLDGRQWSRLDDALARWFGSGEAREMEAWPSLRAEVPFFLALPLGGEAGAGADTVFLEGEIDLLALDEQGQRARVVDYKTGGHPAETDETLRCKHVLQACCYAYALLMQGVQEVEASFVRVERGRADDERQPQCVRYRFAAADAPVLRQAIAKAYQLAQNKA